MGMESGGYDSQASAPPFFHGPPQYLLVAEVHAVEVPQSQYYPAQSTTSARPPSSASL